MAAPVAIGVLVLAGIGVAIADDSSGPTEPKDPTKTFNQHSGDPTTYARTTSPSGKNLAPSSAAQQVLDGLGSSSPVRSVTVSPGPTGSAVTVNLSQNDDDVTSEWISELAVGAIGELMRTNQAVISEEITSATAVGPNRNGVITTTGLGIGAITLGQQFGSPSDETLSAHVNDVAQKFGLKVGPLQILHPLDSAVDVTLVVPSDASIDWTIDQLRTALVGGVPNVEGILIELKAPSGEALLRSGVSYRTGNGVLWFAPGQDGRFGAVHGTLSSR